MNGYQIVSEAVITNRQKQYIINISKKYSVPVDIIIDIVNTCHLKLLEVFKYNSTKYKLKKPIIGPNFTLHKQMFKKGTLSGIISVDCKTNLSGYENAHIEIYVSYSNNPKKEIILKEYESGILACSNKGRLSIGNSMVDDDTIKEFYVEIK